MIDKSVNKGAFPSYFPWVKCTDYSWQEKSKYPKLSIIVPSFNQGDYLEETLLSIINQQYPNLELIVIDGGSTDRSLDILKFYDTHIAYWISEQDKGQSNAINKGLEKATGEWVAWMNSDDCYLEGALHYIFNEINISKIDFLYGQCYSGHTIPSAIEHRHPPEAKKDLKSILRFFYNASHIIPSQSVFIKKSLIDKVGKLNENLHYCMDLDWFCRMYLMTERRFFYDKTICFYRVNGQTKTGGDGSKVLEEAVQVANQYLGFLSQSERQKIERLIIFFTVLRSHISIPHINIIKLVKIAVRFPRLAATNTSFRALFKKSCRNIFSRL